MHYILTDHGDTVLKTNDRLQAIETLERIVSDDPSAADELFVAELENGRMIGLPLRLSPPPTPGPDVLLAALEASLARARVERAAMRPYARSTAERTYKHLRRVA